MYLNTEAAGRPVASLMITYEWSDWRQSFSAQPGPNWRSSSRPDLRDGIWRLGTRAPKRE